MNTTSTPNTDTSAPMNADVDAHAPADSVDVTLGGHHFSVTPMKVRQVFPFLKLARPIFAALAKQPQPPLPGLPQGATGTGQGGTPEAAPEATADALAAFAGADWIMDTLEEHGPALIGALAIGVDAPRESLEDLTVLDLVVLLKHFVGVNASFFTQRGLELPPLNLQQPGGAAKRKKR